MRKKKNQQKNSSQLVNEKGLIECYFDFVLKR